MYEPKDGEWVKIVANTCGHSFNLGSIVRIASKHVDKSAWWVKNSTFYVMAKDIVRPNPSVRKRLKNFEEVVKEFIDNCPEMKSSIRTIVNGLAGETSR